MAAREWRGDGAWLGGSLEELQQFRNCFPFFCSLNCFPRSTVLSEAPPPTPCRSADRRPVGQTPLPSSMPPLETRESEPPLYGELFVIIAFPPTSEAATTAGQITGKSNLLFPPAERTDVVVTGRSSHAVVPTSIDFFFPFRIFGCCIIYAGAVITA